MADEWLKQTARPVKVAQVDATSPNVARVWNYLVGGRDNFEADRRAARQLVAVSPVMAQVGPATRAFHRRVVRYLAESGVRQFLDVGTGMPTAGNTHDIAQEVAPECRVVYVDNDPVVLAHARALLTSTPEGVTSYIDADATEPEKILSESRATLDLSRPVAVILIDILNFITGEAHPARIVATLMGAMVPGSFLVVMQPASDLDPLIESAADRWNQIAPTPVTVRTRAEVTAWTEGLTLLEPGVVQVTQWRPGDPEPGHDGKPGDVMPLYGFVAAKP
ncbi:MAG TPA: SAM-dependent methyltransferase [Trebonia sp.]|nr:SAM-dependent methyltransferase [Trebonia sp.]